MLVGLTQLLTRWLPPVGSGPAEIPEESLWDSTAALNRLGGDHELLAEMKALFVREAPKQLKVLQTGESNAAAIVGAAHALKGMAMPFSAEKTVRLAAQVEKRARAGESDPAGLRILRLVSAVEELIGALRDGT